MTQQLQTSPAPYPQRWVRSSAGPLAGVCEGLGRSFGVAPWTMRVLWILSIAAFGSGLLFYVVLAVCLPREDQVARAQENRLLGVCAQLSRRTGLEVGVVRTLVVLASLASLGITCVAYLALYFFMPDDRPTVAV